MEKLDLKRTYKELYSPNFKEPKLIEVPLLQFLMIDGTGDPNTAPAYKAAVEALFSLSYTLKFKVKKEMGNDYTVGSLEGLWWVEDLEKLSMEDKSNWLWTMMILQPDFITAEIVEAARQEVARKKKVPALPQVCLKRVEEGLSAQILHIGPYAAEKPTIDRLYAFMAANNLHHNGKHHEIYLSDPARSQPEKMKTLIRQPVSR